MQHFRVIYSLTSCLILAILLATNSTNAQQKRYDLVGTVVSIETQGNRGFVYLTLRVKGQNENPSTLINSAKIFSNGKIKEIVDIKVGMLVGVIGGDEAKEIDILPNNFKASIEDKTKDLNLEPFEFDRLDQEYQGCSGVYEDAKQPTDNTKAIFYVSMQGGVKDIAFLKTGGKLFMLKCQNNSTTNQVFKGGGLTAILTIISKKAVEEEESSKEIGTLEISNGKSRIKIKVHGTSGC